MSALTEKTIRKALAAVTDPTSGADIATTGRIARIAVKEKGRIFIELLAAKEEAELLAPLLPVIKKELMGLDGVEKVTAVLTEPEKPSGCASYEPKSDDQRAAHSHAAAKPEALPVPGVKAVIAVASGKGGVGKSTTAVNLALALKEKGVKVGLYDADVHGPSLPSMMGIHDKGVEGEGGGGQPVQPKMAHGLPCMSIGFLLPDDTPTVWRGPMVAQAVEQMIMETNWGGLDILIVDMPPGTGDVQITMGQKIDLAGAVIVSTPQEIALSDVRRGIVMFGKVDVPVLGLIENMSGFACPCCDEITPIFGENGVQKTAEKFNVPVLGGVPLVPAVREKGDAGQPILEADKTNPASVAYLAIADALLENETVKKALAGEAKMMANASSSCSSGSCDPSASAAEDCCGGSCGCSH